MAFLYDGDNVVADMVDVGGTLGVDRFYVTPYLDQNVSMTDVGSGQSYYYTADGLGSVRTLTDSNGDLENAYKYAAFGEVYTDFSTQENVVQRYGFTGREKSSVSGAPMYYRYRWLDNKVGRFGSRDPWYYRLGANLYRYVDANPTIYIDPSGGLGITLVHHAANIQGAEAKWKWEPDDDEQNGHIVQEVFTRIQLWDCDGNFKGQVIHHLWEMWPVVDGKGTDVTFLVVVYEAPSGPISGTAEWVEELRKRRKGITVLKYHLPLYDYFIERSKDCTIGRSTSVGIAKFVKDFDAEGFAPGIFPLTEKEKKGIVDPGKNAVGHGGGYFQGDATTGRVPSSPNKPKGWTRKGTIRHSLDYRWIRCDVQTYWSRATPGYSPGKYSPGGPAVIGDPGSPLGLPAIPK